MSVPAALQAGLWGLVAGGALVLGAAVAWFVHVPQRLIAAIMAFGAGVLISALAFELMDEAYRKGGFDSTAMGGGGEGDLFSQAVQIVKRDRKASTSYIQRRLQIGYNRAASLVERMENEGLIGPANHAGKREILVGRDEAATPY